MTLNGHGPLVWVVIVWGFFDRTGHVVAVAGGLCSIRAGDSLGTNKEDSVKESTVNRFLLLLLAAFIIFCISYALLAQSVREGLDPGSLKQAEAGNVHIQILVGLHYSRNCPASERDYPEAVRWFQRAADQGSPIGYFRLGLAYLHGQGVKKNLCEATKWLDKAIQRTIKAHAKNDPGGLDLLTHYTMIQQDAADGYMVLRMAADRAPRNWRITKTLEKMRGRLKPYEHKTAVTMADVLAKFIEGVNQH